MASLTSQVLGSYKLLLRASTRAFLQDYRAQDAAYAKIRSEFESRRDLDSEEQIKESILHAQQAADFLQKAVLQGEVNKEKQSVGFKVSPSMKEALKEGHVHLEPPVARRRKKATAKVNELVKDRVEKAREEN